MVGFPHSEIPGSKLVRSSPRLIAAYYVLHRLHAPRHPLDALKALDRSHYRCPQRPRTPLEKVRLVMGKNEMPRLTARRILIGQIKLTRIHVLGCFSPGYGSNETDKHLFTMSKDPAAAPPEGRPRPNLLSVRDVMESEQWWSQSGSNRRPHACKARALPTELWPRSRANSE
jgi:hypothetical protein